MKHGLLFSFCILSLLTPPDFAQNLSNNESSDLVNLNPDTHGDPWIAGGITFEEWSRTLPPSMRSLPKKNATYSEPPPTAPYLAPLPSKVDNTKNPAFRPIFVQKGGSCAQASGVAYIYTYEINVLRNLSSHMAKNQYPYDFTYNFLNSGNGKNGSHPNVGWYIINRNGVPDVETYGGFGQGKFTRWMSGYDAYYKGMSNRLESTFSIRIKTALDILKMKKFLYDHLNGSPTGGILSFSANTKNLKIVRLAPKTPEAGDKAVVSFGNSCGHTMTIAGYNDSVRYDYNGDGRYTNNVDLNGDSILDVRDWEIGAAYMVNSWGTSWGTNGKAYLMYKVLAESKKNRGVWKNAVAGISITKKNVTPQLTYKVRMRFNTRSGLRIKAGFSANTNSFSPSVTKSFGRAFNYSGGEFPMQGVNDEPIEIGLDVSDFLSRMTSSEAAFFLQVESRNGSGVVEYFSVIDYTSGQPVESVCRDKNVSIATGTKRLKIVKSKAALLVVSPNGGENWERERTYNIIWSTKDNNPVQIELLKGGKFHSTIASSAPSTGTFAWKIFPNIPSAFDYCIRITNKEKKWLNDESDSNFGIGFPIIEAPYTQSFDGFMEGESLINNWEQVNDDDINWRIVKGATPSKTDPQRGGTGPDGDHTNGSGKYFYVEASTPNNQGKEAILLSPVFNISNLDGAQVSLWIHMFSRGKNMGAMWIDVCDDGQWKDSVLYLTGDHGDRWFKQTLDLTGFDSEHVQFRFRVLTGTDYDSDICIDDFSIIDTKTMRIANENNKLFQPSFLISPNVIQLFGYSTGIPVKIFTVDGRQILEKTIGSSHVTINISKLSHGMYLLDINNRSIPFVRLK